MSEVEEYQHGLRNRLLPIYHNMYHRNEQDRNDYVAYSVRDKELREYLHYWYIFQTKEDFDFTWYAACNSYIQSMSPADKYRIRCYSRQSDDIVNTFLRVGQYSITPRKLAGMQQARLYFFLPDVLETVYTSEGKLQESAIAMAAAEGQRISQDPILFTEMILRYIDHLRRIIRGAPRLTQDLLVFRGVKTDYLRYEGILRGFQSTTFSPRVAYFFGEEENMVYELHVSTQTPCLCIHSISESHEFEVLLDTDLYALASPKILEKYHMDLQAGDGMIPPTHLWDPDSTDSQGQRIYMRSRELWIHAEPTLGSMGGFQTKNRTRRRSTRPRTMAKTKPLFDPKDPTAATLVPTEVPAILRANYATYRQKNPRMK